MIADEILNTKGRIFDIQRFSVHDGPGIRTIVFFKGCVLRCKWCCNPEGQNYNVENMKDAKGNLKTVGYDITVRELIEIINKDRIYYRRSKNGGVTLSGGEFLTQIDFAYALLKACKDNGITTAVETTSCASFENIQKVLPFIDTYLMDIKNIDSNKHKEFTGRTNELILENAKKISKEAKKLIIRVPVIPTFNDTVEEISAIAKFTSTLGNVNELHLLPYHRLGMDKYHRLGRDYPMGEAKTPSKEKMEEFKKAVEGFGLICKIGG